MASLVENVIYDLRGRRDNIGSEYAAFQALNEMTNLELLAAISNALDKVVAEIVQQALQNLTGPPQPMTDEVRIARMRSALGSAKKWIKNHENVRKSVKAAILSKIDEALK